jgi:hypothetical protein
VLLPATDCCFFWLQAFLGFPASPQADWLLLATSAGAAPGVILHVFVYDILANKSRGKYELYLLQFQLLTRPVSPSVLESG